MFYNGEEDRPESEVLRLSDLFEKPMASPEIELECVVYNINTGKQDGLLGKCAVLLEYMQFIDRIRYYESINDDSPIQSAIDWCVKNHVLEEFLKAREAEVLKAMALDYTFERQLELTRRDMLEEGRQEGIAEERINCIRKMLVSGITPERIAEICSYPMQEILEVKSKM